MELMLEKYSGTVCAVNIGATPADGGTRSKVISVGGEKALPCLSAEGELPHRPVIAAEIWDIPLEGRPESKDPITWAQNCAQDRNVQLLCVRLQGAHPDSGNRKPQEEAEFVKELLKKVALPLIIVGCGDDEKDNQVIPACCEASRGQRCLIGNVSQDNYKTITAAVIADGHNIIAESPIDINIAKQLNILISDMGLSLERIVINPTIGALGYGLEYAYSIMERARLAALAADKTVASPFICFVGQEAWRAKEAKEGGIEQGIIWEIITAAALIQAGADILVMRHPKAITKINWYIEKLNKS